MLSRSSVLALAGASVVALLSGCSGDATVNRQGRGDSTSTWQTLTMAQPAWATNGLGQVSDGQQVQIQIHLKMHNEAQANAQLAAISDPKSPSYHHFLTNEQFAAAYGPTADEVALLAAHLGSYGATVTYVPNNRAFISAQGTAAQIGAAFGTTLGQFQVGSEVRMAPLSAPRMPPALTPSVLSVLGLSTPAVMGTHRVRVGGIGRSSVASMVSPHDGPGTSACSEWFGATLDPAAPPYAPGYAPLALGPCAYRPAQLRSAYGLNTIIRHGNDGTGVSVAIVDAFLSPTLLQDAQTYAANNDPDYPLAASQFSAVMAPGTATTPDPGWFGEQSLDVEAVHALAPGANIVYVGAQSATDLDLAAAINYIVDNNLANIISNSWGSPENLPNDFVIFHHAATQAGLKGVGLFFSSGDNGDESANPNGFGVPTPDFPASLDNVTAVGGTSLAFDQTGAVLWQLGWETGASFNQPTPNGDGGVLTDGDGGVLMSWQPAAPGFFVFGAGGGTSEVYEQPAYQVGIVPDALANLQGAPARVVPDVAMLADPMTGFLIGMTDPTAHTYGESQIGGTSLACPLFAATMALAQQNAGHAFGFANATLYAASANGAFTDIAPGATPQAVALPLLDASGDVIQAAVTFDYAAQSIKTAVGFDNVTGLGAPNGQAFLDNVQ